MGSPGSGPRVCWMVDVAPAIIVTPSVIPRRVPPNAALRIRLPRLWPPLRVAHPSRRRAAVSRVRPEEAEPPDQRPGRPHQVERPRLPGQGSRDLRRLGLRRELRAVRSRRRAAPSLRGPPFSPGSIPEGVPRAFRQCLEAQVRMIGDRSLRTRTWLLAPPTGPLQRENQRSSTMNTTAPTHARQNVRTLPIVFLETTIPFPSVNCRSHFTPEYVPVRFGLVCRVSDEPPELSHRHMVSPQIEWLGYSHLMARILVAKPTMTIFVRYKRLLQFRFRFLRAHHELPGRDPHQSHANGVRNRGTWRIDCRRRGFRGGTGR